jgi:transposase-like protein
MPADLPPCPSCDSEQIVKNGKIHNGKQNYKCRDCSRQFVKDPQNKIINQKTKNLIDKFC